MVNFGASKLGVRGGGGPGPRGPPLDPLVPGVSKMTFFQTFFFQNVKEAN